MAEGRITTRTREILRRHGLHLKKSLGQNFLTEDHVLHQIVEAADLDENAGVLEIGPGIGALTEHLAEEAKSVIAVELDQRLLPILQELFVAYPHVTILHGDAMKVDLHQVIEEHLGDCKKRHVVANLPYYVTSPILMRLLEERLPLDSIVIMVQKEVAERLTSEPGTKAYGSITVTTQYFTEPEWVTLVPAHVFMPPPQVDSAVIRLKIRPKPPVAVNNEGLFFRVVRASFGQRRKTLPNAISAGLFGGKRKGEITLWLEEAGIDPKRRGETLSLEEFAHFTNFLDERLDEHA
ncbi:16S rRNA (adenine(1518)-N(6)/adenine(1519)-N(6))-dimethyltransferase RsmA [Marininema halotolerans]|uniref:Ribosomal RNA small subunit methyltransferase A n=1 Tax=Marininema halotolerans TaxID=1155944 RepID=A0A1I6TCS2_9BACL|nr:16S rRNA (adenine(1518)-N(6)/adenine(1519)-N(6))-dimethyltransferase RsmA [Marininema halotolerans]SFS86980.1 16S rRNA (adenine1518-N6/adenine1519-N6)-dimethyltransferase [Marininema halotolerans]